MYVVCLSTPSDLHGPSDWHEVSTGRTLSIALARARAKLNTYGAVVIPGRLFYMVGDGMRYPLISA